MKKITIVGGGLAGTLLAIFLAKRGYTIDIYDARRDLRLAKKDNGRSINLAMSCRGLTALKQAGLQEKVAKLTVPMRARAIHESENHISYQSFGRNSEEYINAIQRTDLNSLLLNEVEQFPHVRLHFNCKIQEIDFKNKQLLIQKLDEKPKLIAYEMLIGADGASSAVRENMQQQGILNYTRDFLDYGYKEIAIVPARNQLVPEHLHLWPRDEYLLLGNPNCDSSVTGSLFLPNQGKNSFAELDDEIKVRNFFKRSFPDICASMPNLVSDFITHPTGTMSTIKCSTWYYKNCLLIGDAAHGIVPFFGQGMNCAFEDCRILNELLIEHQDDWSKVSPEFYQARLPNCNAVAAMSLANFREIQTDIRDPEFNFKKQLEQQLMLRYPQTYVSKHVLVMFTNTSYAKALEVGNVQSQLLNKIFSNFQQLKTIDWNYVDCLMGEYDKNLTKQS